MRTYYYYNSDEKKYKRKAFLVIGLIFTIAVIISTYVTNMEKKDAFQSYTQGRTTEVYGTCFVYDDQLFFIDKSNKVYLVK
jgi:hypothetical protein